LSEEIVDRPGVIEPALWGELKFLAEPLCSRCGFPLPDDAGPKAVCGACAGRKPAYDSARAALAYDDHARRLILDLKRGGRRDGLPGFARWMAAAAGETLGRCRFHRACADALDAPCGAQLQSGPRGWRRRFLRPPENAGSRARYGG
jgi:hypothetical protein